MEFLKKRFSLTSDPDKDKEENGANLLETFTSKRSNLWNGITAKLTDKGDGEKLGQNEGLVEAVRQKWQSVRLFENGDTDSDEDQDARQKSHHVECGSLIDTTENSTDPAEVLVSNGVDQSNSASCVQPSQRPKLVKRQESFTAEEVYLDTVAAQMQAGLLVPDASTIVVSPNKAVDEFVFSADASKAGSSKQLSVPNQNLINFDSIHNLSQAAKSPADVIVHREDDNDIIYDYSSDDSTEPVYSDNVARRNGSFDSLLSQDDMDEETKRMNEFTKAFVDRIFAGDTNSNEDKAIFGKYVRDGNFRHQFARCVSEKRAFKHKITEHSFYQLVQFFAVVLFECDEADDFTPAKTLMTMCFTFYYETQKHGILEKQYLYNYLKSQPIWQSMRYWNAAFFETVQQERAKKPLTTNKSSSDDEDQDRLFQENIIFGQLGTFLHNMREFGLSLEWCFEFLRKQATIGNLKQDKVDMLRENLESMA